MGKRERKDSIGNSSKKEEKKAKKKKEKKEKKKHRSSTGSDGKSKHHQNGQKIQESGEKSHPVVSQDESKKSPDKKRRKTSGMAAAAPGTVAISQVTNRGNNNSYKKAFILKKKIVLAISLLPGALRNSQKAVENNIARLLFKNTPGIGGIMLSYANLKFSKSKNTSGSESAQSSGHGWILNELPYIHFDVSCDMMVFRPFVGCELHGVVNECFPSHISILVLQYFNAMVSAEELLAAGYKFDFVSHSWVCATDAPPPENDTAANSNSSNNNDDIDNEAIMNGMTLSTGSKLHFIVDKIHESEGTISLEGVKPTLSMIVETS